MNDASNFVRVLEERQGLKMACLEEIAWRNNWITTIDLVNLASKYSNPLGDYLRILAKTK
jgi:glucose-1-phosphate thymidylyltransferase